MLVMLQMLISSPFNFKENTVRLTSVFTFLNSDAYLSESQVIWHALCNVCGGEQTVSTQEVVTVSILSCYGSVVFCLMKLEKEIAIVICNVSITL